MDNLTAVGKLFFANLVSFINNDGQKFIWKLKGDPEKIQVFTKVIMAIKDYQTEIKKPDTTIDKIIKKMQAKNQAIQEFEATFGKKWPI
jgi:hypothetical protein